MSLEQNKAIVHRYAVEPWSTGNLAVLDELCSPDLAVNGTFPLADFRQLIVDTRRAIPDLTNTVEEMIAEGDKVVFRWTMRGTHRGDYQGIAPTGKPVTATGITIVRLANGKIVEDRFESGSPGFEAAGERTGKQIAPSQGRRYARGVGHSSLHPYLTMPARRRA